MQGATVRSEPGREDLRIIGPGSCGTVFEIPGNKLAFKKGTSVLGIWSDFRLTNKVHNAVSHIRTIMQEAFPHSTIPMTPLRHNHYPAGHEKFWSENIQLFPASHRTRQPVFTVDRILPLPQVTREGLIEMYFQQNEEVQKKAKNDPENKDCLVRIYLGERETFSQQFAAYETLRSFPLRLNMMEYLEVEVSELVNEMAIGLAILHWQAQVNGMDVEFVLGSCTRSDFDGYGLAR